MQAVSTLGYAAPVALFEVAPAPACGIRAGGDLCQTPATGIVFHVPPQTRYFPFRGTLTGDLSLVIYENERIVAKVGCIPVGDNFVFWARGGTLERVWPQPSPTHADGTPVTGTHPARAGEVLDVILTGVQGAVTEGGEPQPEGLSKILLASSAFGAEPIPSKDATQEVRVEPVAGKPGLWRAKIQMPSFIPPTLPRCGQGFNSSYNYGVSLFGISIFVKPTVLGICAAPEM